MRSKISAALLRAAKRRALSREDVLLHHEPARITKSIQLLKKGREVDTAFTQLTKYARAKCLKIIKPLLSGRVGHTIATVFEVHVPNPRRILAQNAGRVAAAKMTVSGIETEPKQVGIGAFHERGDFLRGFDITAAMMVKDGCEACLIFHGLSHTVGAGHKVIPLF